MNRRSLVYVSALLIFSSVAIPAYAQTFRLGQKFCSFGLQSAVAVGSPPVANAVQTEYLQQIDGLFSASEYEQNLMVPETANSFINSITAIGITYTVNDMKASLNKLKARNVRASKPFLDNLLLADALLNEMRLKKGPSVVQGVPGVTSFNSPPGSSVAQGVPGIASFSSPVNLGAIAGTYRYEPYSNAWQEGTLEPTGDFRLKWTNKAKVAWGLTADLQTGILRKDEGSPYQDQPNGKEFVIVRDAKGNVTGFQFQGALYRKIGE